MGCHWVVIEVRGRRFRSAGASTPHRTAHEALVNELSNISGLRENRNLDQRRGSSITVNRELLGAFEHLNGAL
jgi:hypothetical protein